MGALKTVNLSTRVLNEPKREVKKKKESIYFDIGRIFCKIELAKIGTN